eukprot:6458735-Alexandrium_andersonii.AAC.1
MSASLVGSEMCIRDSSYPRRFNCLIALRTSDFSARWLVWKAMIRGKAPVSYTHLTLPTICSV